MPDSQQYELPRFDLMVARVRGGGRKPHHPSFSVGTGRTFLDISRFEDILKSEVVNFPQAIHLM